MGREPESLQSLQSSLRINSSDITLFKLHLWL